MIVLAMFSIKKSHLYFSRHHDDISESLGTILTVKKMIRLSRRSIISEVIIHQASEQTMYYDSLIIKHYNYHLHLN